jgi:hypothetical protein
MIDLIVRIVKSHFILRLYFGVDINSLRTDGDFCHQGRDTEIAPKTIRLSKPTDMTIHWKTLEHFLMVSLVF